MGVRIREKVKDSGIWWLFINYKGKRTSRLIGTKKAAEKAMDHAQARLKLGQDALPKEKPSYPSSSSTGKLWRKPIYLLASGKARSIVIGEASISVFSRNLAQFGSMNSLVKR